MTRLGDNARGAILMAACMAAFTTNDTFMKLLGSELPLFQVMFMRGVVITAVFFLIGVRTGAFRVRLDARDTRLVVVRTLAEAVGAMLFLSALFNMPLANATAVLQLLPLTVTLGAALFLGEVIGWRRMLAIIAGFVGVLLIAQPGTEGFTLWSLPALMAVVMLTVRELTTRKMSPSVPSMLVATAAAAGVALAGAVGTVGAEWVAPSPVAWGWLGGSIVFVGMGYLLSVMAVRVGDMGFVAPFRYANLVWALILGLLVFGDWPDALTLIGAAIVVGAGLFTFARERRLARNPVATDTEPRA